MKSAESKFHDVDVAVAEKMGLLCSIVFNARRALRSGLNPETVAHGPKSKAIAKTIRTEGQASMMLNMLIPNSKLLTGAGGQSLVFKNEDTVDKLSYRTLGLQSKQLKELTFHRASYLANLAQDLGEIMLPTAVDVGNLRFRFPSHAWETIILSQPLQTGFIDAFSDAGKEVFRQGDAQLRKDALTLSKVTADRLVDGQMIDVTRDGNVIIDSSNRLRLIDVLPIEPEFHDMLLHNTNVSVTEFAWQRIDLLGELAISPRSFTA